MAWGKKRLASTGGDDKDAIASIYIRPAQAGKAQRAHRFAT
jgi:hypothetical protein